MKNLTQLVIGTVALFMTVAPFPSFAQVIQPIDRLAVFDENGERLGPVVGVLGPQAPPSTLGLQNGGVWFSMKVDQSTVLLAVDQNSALYGTGVDEIYFESASCTGTPLFRTSFLNSLLPSESWLGGPNPGQAGGGGDNIVYVPDPNATPQTLTILARVSRLVAQGEICDDITANFEVINSLALVDLDAAFTRPLHVKAEVGGDFDSIQDQIDALETQVGALSEENALLLQKLRRVVGGLKQHTHNYRTGKGQGHNNTGADTGKANLP